MENENIVNSPIPSKYKPISAWGYVGYQLLFSIPLIGFIFVLVFALGGTNNENLKNYSRSYFCWWICILFWRLKTIFLIVFLLQIS